MAKPSVQSVKAELDTFTALINKWTDKWNS